MSALVQQMQRYYAHAHPGRALRPYQLEIAYAREIAVLESQDNLQAVVDQLELIARQGGKNECDCQNSIRMLMKVGRRRRLRNLPFGLAIKTAPSYKPGIEMSRRRFELALNDIPKRLAKLEKRGSYIYQLNGDPAGIGFLSAGKEANKRGETANLWLSVDECQDTDAEVYDAELAPMRATTAAPAFFSGTMKGEQCLSNVLLQRLTAEQEKDGRRRVFVYDWQAVAAHNEAYGRFVERERDRLGIGNPIFLAEYCLTPIRAAGMFFADGDVEKLMGGKHERETVRGADAPETVLVGGVDFCGADETEGDEAWDPDRQRKRDSTVAAIGLLRWKKDADGLHPIVQVVDLLWLSGMPPVAQVDKLEQFLFHKYRCAKVVVDGRGVGDAPAAMLERRRGGQVDVLQSGVADVTRMGWNLLSMVQSGRLTMWRCDESREWSEMRIQCQELRRTVRANQTLRWEAPTRMPLVNGVRTPVHDDGPKALGYLTEAAHRHLTAGKPVERLREFLPWAEAQATAYGEVA